MKYLFLLLIVTNVFAVQIPPESLFRQAANEDLSNNTTSISFIVKKNNADGDSQSYLRLILSAEQEKFRISQFEFNSSEMTNDKLVHAFSTSNIESYIGKDSVKDIFVHLIYFLYHNQSRKFFSYLKTIEPDLKSNNELVNKEKVKLLESYKAHLQKQSDINPLKPTSLEEKKKTNELMESSLYLAEASRYEMVLNHKTVQIKLTYPHFSAYFNNQTHRLEHIDFNLKDLISVNIEEYTSLTGINLYPKFINIKIGEDQYRLQVISVKQVNENYVDFEKRASGTDALIKKGAKSNTSSLPFIF